MHKRGATCPPMTQIQVNLNGVFIWFQEIPQKASKMRPWKWLPKPGMATGGIEAAAAEPSGMP